MRLYKHKKSKVWYMDYTDFSGNRHRESTGTGTKKLAEQIAAKKEVEILNQKKLGIKPVKSVLFSEFSKEYLKMSVANKVPGSVAMDKIALKNFKEILGDRILSDIEEGDIESYKVERLKSIAPATVHREMNTIKNMFKIALRRGYTRKDPCKYVKKPQEPPGRLRYLSKDEIKRLLKECKKYSYLHLFVVIALNTGMRKGEILGLKWKDIDFENSLIHLEQTKNRERADVLMNAFIIETLNEYRESVKEKPQESSSVIPVNSIKKSFKGAVVRAKIKDFRIHDLRHTFASHLVMNNIPLNVVKELMRHKSFKMTLRYAHLSPTQKKDAVEKLAQIWHTKKEEKLKA